MKFAVKALVMGLSANAIRLEQKAQLYPYAYAEAYPYAYTESYSYPSSYVVDTSSYAYTAPTAYNSWSSSVSDYVSPNFVPKDPARYTHPVAECHECEEQVCED